MKRFGDELIAMLAFYFLMGRVVQFNYCNDPRRWRRQHEIKMFLRNLTPMRAIQIGDSDHVGEANLK